MATRYMQVAEQYEAMLRTLPAPAVWQAFLCAAGRNYKCRFDEQVLIYAQRPDATAVLELERWNRLFHRRVNRGARSIAVFNRTPPQENALKYYFDLTDTHSDHREGEARAVPIWKLREQDEQAVIETLESTVGDLEHKENLVQAVKNAAQNAAIDHMDTYFDELLAQPEILQADISQAAETSLRRLHGNTEKTALLHGRI